MSSPPRTRGRGAWRPGATRAIRGGLGVAIALAGLCRTVAADESTVPIVPALASLDRAEDPVLEHGPWLSAGLLAGATQLDGRLADYQWDTRLHPAWGGQILAGAGRFAAGLRLWSTRTTQDLNVSGVTTIPIVHSTSVEAVGRSRLASWLQSGLLLTASFGRLELTYEPDQVAIPSGGAGGPIVVALRPIHEWIGGAGIAIERAIDSNWNTSLEIEFGRFALDTAHRSGAGIVNVRQSFGEWNARLEIARRFRRR